MLKDPDKYMFSIKNNYPGEKIWEDD